MSETSKCGTTWFSVALAGTVLCLIWQSHRHAQTIGKLRRENAQLLSERDARRADADLVLPPAQAVAQSDSSSPAPELLKLRGEVARQRHEAQEQADFLASLKDSTRKINQLGAQAQWESFLLQARVRLGLTEEQERSLRALSQHDPFPSKDDHRADWDKILTAAQQSALAQLEQEAKADVERLNACDLALVAMKDIQFYVGLSREQQDRAFPALMDYAARKARDEAELELHPERSSSPGMTGADWLQLQLEALRGILTDEQLAIYQRYKEDLARAQPKGD